MNYLVAHIARKPPIKVCAGCGVSRAGDTDKLAHVTRYCSCHRSPPAGPSPVLAVLGGCGPTPPTSRSGMSVSTSSPLCLATHPSSTHSGGQTLCSLKHGFRLARRSASPLCDLSPPPLQSFHQYFLPIIQLLSILFPTVCLYMLHCMFSDVQRVPRVRAHTAVELVDWLGMCTTCQTMHVGSLSSQPVGCALLYSIQGMHTLIS